MKIADFLKISPGVTAVIGGGGKTTLLTLLAQELRDQGSVLLCTTTKILPFSAYAVLIDRELEEISRTLEAQGVVCIGSQAAEGKLSQPRQSFRELETLADFVLVEADGAKGCPLKAHAPHEPVIPPESNQVIYVLGADGFGQPIGQVCHRPELYSALCGAPQDAPVTAALAARVLTAEGCGDRFFINKAETAQDYQNARRLAALLDRPMVCGSLHRRDFLCLP